MPLFPDADIEANIRWHQEMVKSTFGVETSGVLFPPETAFHPRMIPALNRSGIKAVIYDSVHRYRATEGYPYRGAEEGLLPPNPAEQRNPAVDDWMSLQNVWAPGMVSPSMMRPEWLSMVDADGKEHRIIGIPAERYLGNEDARGGFGALQYPHVFEQLIHQLEESGHYDPQHPPYFMLHSDGDNYGGGADSYYYHNTGSMVRWLQEDPRFELMTPLDYLEKFPPDPKHAIHVEPGSWAGADNGDPYFRKWFSRHTESYSPDINSWAVLTAMQNWVHSLKQQHPDAPELRAMEKLLLSAGTSCYWYWTGQDEWDAQVSLASQAMGRLLGGHRETLARWDNGGPTIFPAWVTPENPGGQTWGQGGLMPAAKKGILRTLVHDISGVQKVDVVVTGASGSRERITLRDTGAYPSRTSPFDVAHLYEWEMPEGAGMITYFIEAMDSLGNVSRGSLERIYLA